MVGTFFFPPSKKLASYLNPQYHSNIWLVEY